MTEPDVVRIIISMVFVVLLILLIGWGARKVGWLRNTQSTGIKVLGVQNLGARTFVAVIQVEDTRLVVGVTPHTVSLLHSHTLPAAAAHACTGTDNETAESTAQSPLPSGDSAARTTHTPQPNSAKGFSQLLQSVTRKR